jgi:hypothetical protein
MRRFLLLAVLGVVTASGSASATTPPPGYRAVQTTEVRVVYETRRVSYTKEEIRYDHCDRPYKVLVTAYRTVEVPVEKTVTVTRYVRCDY